MEYSFFRNSLSNRNVSLSSLTSDNFLTVASSPSNKVLYFTSSKGHPRKKRVALFWQIL